MADISNSSDKIKPIMKTATASFGITALNELQELYNGKSLAEDGQFALETLQYINDKGRTVQERGRLNLYYLRYTGRVCAVCRSSSSARNTASSRVFPDRPYVQQLPLPRYRGPDTDSKQDLEGRFWNLCNGGKIQYVKYPIDYNHEAIRSLVRRARGKGLLRVSALHCVPR